MLENQLFIFPKKIDTHLLILLASQPLGTFNSRLILVLLIESIIDLQGNEGGIDQQQAESVTKVFEF